MRTAELAAHRIAWCVLAGALAAAPCAPAHAQVAADGEHTYIVRGLAFDGLPEPAEPGAGIEPASPSRDGALPLDEPGPVEPSVAAAEAPLSIPDLICSYSWPCGEALAVARCESGFQPYAENGRYKGIFQLDAQGGGHFARFGYDASQWANPTVNVTVAYLLWQTSGWQPWSCKP